MEKVNWLNLNSELHSRSERAGIEYDKLKEKIRNCLRNEQNLNDLNEQQSIFNRNAEGYFADSYEILTAQGYKSEDDGFNNSERNKLTKKIHTLRSLKDWEKLGFTTEYLHNGNYGQRHQAIESEFYEIIKDLIANSILYSQADFQTIK